MKTGSALGFSSSVNTSWHRIALLVIVYPWLLFLVFLFLPPALASRVDVSVVHSRDQYPAGSTYPIAFRIRIDTPWYIHGNEGEKGELARTSLSFKEIAGVKVQGVEFPEPEEKELPYTETPVKLFSGDLLVRAILKVSEDARIGERSMEGTLRFQACSSRSCLPPQDLHFTWKVLVSPKGSTSEPRNGQVFQEGEQNLFLRGQGRWSLFQGGLWLGLLGVFLSGIALNLTPCIYPLIPVTVSYFAGRGHGLHGSTMVHGLLYLFGLSMTNTTLGVTAALSGGMLGEALQNPIVPLAVALILIAMGSSFLGLWEVRVPYFLNRLLSIGFSGYLGSLFMGLTLGVIAAPCLGPFILGLLAYVGNQGDPYLGFCVFFVLSMGLGLPIAVLAVFSGSIDKLPVSGGWMVWIRRLLGWVLIGMAGYMLQTLIPGTGMDFVPIAVVLALAGLDLGWLARPETEAGSRFAYFRRGAAMLLLAGAFFLSVVSVGTKEGVKWIPYDETSLTRAKGESPVMLDFYADWCLPCKVMDNIVFTDPRVVSLSKGFVNIRVDLSKKTPSHQKLRKRFHIKGVPTVIFLNKMLEEEKDLRIESYVDPDTMVKRMRRIADS